MIYEIDDIELEVNYSIDWGHPASRDDPGEPAYVDSLEVILGDCDITALLRDSVIAQIEEACFEDAARREKYESMP